MTRPTGARALLRFGRRLVAMSVLVGALALTGMAIEHSPLGAANTPHRDAVTPPHLIRQGGKVFIVGPDAAPQGMLLRLSNGAEVRAREISSSGGSPPDVDAWTQMARILVLVAVIALFVGGIDWSVRLRRRRTPAR